nr:MAG TPA: hypothetical protein [Caudoviricetes sp.]
MSVIREIHKACYGKRRYVRPAYVEIRCCP